MKTKVKKDESFKMSLRLPHECGKAMEIVWNTDRVSKTRQIELGLRLYMEKYKELLLGNGVDVWKKKKIYD